MEITRRHRFADELPEGISPQPITRPSRRREAILRVFTPDHPYLPSHVLSHLAGNSHQGNVRESMRMAEKVNGLLAKPYQQQFSHNAGYKHLVYERTAAGARFIGASNGAKQKKREYAHQLLDSLFVASLKIEAAGCGVRLLTWDEIAVHPKYVGDGNYAHIKLSDSVLQPDGRPFIITAGGRSVCFLKEIDRRTEPLMSDSDRPAIAAKLQQYRELMATRGYRRLGFHNCMVVILTTRPLDGVLRLVERIFGDAPPSWLLLQRTEDWAHARHFPSIDGTVKNSTAIFRMLSTPYVRAGGLPPFSLQHLMEVPIEHS